MKGLLSDFSYLWKKKETQVAMCERRITTNQSKIILTDHPLSYDETFIS